MGLGTFVVKNRALPAKWWWRFGEEKNALGRMREVKFLGYLCLNIGRMREVKFLEEFLGT